METTELLYIFVANFFAAHTAYVVGEVTFSSLRGQNTLDGLISSSLPLFLREEAISQELFHISTDIYSNNALVSVSNNVGKSISRTEQEDDD